MTKALASTLLYWRSLSKKYPLHHNHTQPKKFSSKFRKLHVRYYSIVLKSDKNRVACYLRVAFLASELHLYLHILIYMFYPCIYFLASTKWGLNFWTEPRLETTLQIISKTKQKLSPFTIKHPSSPMYQ